MKHEKLAKNFFKWYEKEYKKVWDEWHGINIPEDILQKLNLDDDEYYNKYVKPYLKLNKEQIKGALKFLAGCLQDKLTPQPSPFCLSLKIDISPKINALEWLLVHIADLKYFEFNDFLKSKYKKPYNQCLICGKPDYYEIETAADKIQKKYFTHKKKYCHKKGCTEDNSNPREHVEGCHYKEWARLKKTMNQKLTRILTKIKEYEKDKNLIDDEKTTKIKEAEKEYYKVFEDFYLEQYKKNCKIFYTIRKSEKDEVFDIREF